MILKGLPIDIDKDNLINRFIDLKYDNKFIRENIDELYGIAQNIQHNRIYYDIFNIYSDKEDRIILNDDYFFPDISDIKNFKHFNQVVLAICTLGAEYDKQVSKFFKEGHYLKGMMLDIIGNEFLENLIKNFRNILKDNNEINRLYISEPFFPGGTEREYEIQKAIFNKLKIDDKELYINNSCIIEPGKSTSFILGLSNMILHLKNENLCESCELNNCTYRKNSKRQYEIIINYKENQKKITANEGENLFDVLLKNNIFVTNFCGGAKTCGKCKISIKGSLNYSENEKKFLTDNEIKNNIKLACFTSIDSDMEIFIPNENSGQKILSDVFAITKKYNFKPRIKQKNFLIKKSVMINQKDFVSMIIEQFNKNVKIPIKIFKDIPETIKNSNNSFSCLLRNNEIVSIKKTDDKNEFYGIALDIGTTTLVAYLFNLNNGNYIDVYSSLNPQKNYGADVISRINYTILNKEGLIDIQKAIINKINEIVGEFCKRNLIKREEIFEIVAVGNTTMIHFLLGIPAYSIAISPYTPVFTTKVEAKACSFGININQEGYIITLPLVSSYIGSDTIAAIIDNRMYEKEDISLLIDIGTNGEMVLGNKNGLIACSAAAGPAFEGAGIAFGMGATDGAIDHVNFSKNKYYTTINNSIPKGICGSGIVDLIAELIKYKVIDTTGKILKREELKETPLYIADKITQYNDEPAFLLVDEIYITQRDIRQIQLAKAAIAAGINIMIYKKGLEIKNIDKVYLAGGFGNYITPENAVKIGLIPAELREKIVQTGNSAGSGAIMTLLSDDYLEIAEKIKNMTEYIELSFEPSFQEQFIKEINL